MLLFGFVTEYFYVNICCKKNFVIEIITHSLSDLFGASGTLDWVSSYKTTLQIPSNLFFVYS